MALLHTGMAPLRTSTTLPRLLFLVLPLILTTGTARADQAILIGGGYNVNTSQGQIELNVRWVQDVLKRSDLPVVTFFTDGDNSAPDVHYLKSESTDTGTDASAIDDLAEQLEPVARLFDNQLANKRRYRNHEVDPAPQSAFYRQVLSDNPDCAYSEVMPVYQRGTHWRYQTFAS